MAKYGKYSKYDYNKLLESSIPSNSLYVKNNDINYKNEIKLNQIEIENQKPQLKDEKKIIIKKTYFDSLFQPNELVKDKIILSDNVESSIKNTFDNLEVYPEYKVISSYKNPIKENFLNINKKIRNSSLIKIGNIAVFDKFNYGISSNKNWGNTMIIGELSSNLISSLPIKKNISSLDPESKKYRSIFTENKVSTNEKKIKSFK